MFCCTIYNPLKYYQSPQNSLSEELELKGLLVQLVCVEKGQTIFQKHRHLKMVEVNCTEPFFFVGAPRLNLQQYFSGIRSRPYLNLFLLFKFNGV
jgi:hypothetical protein